MKKNNYILSFFILMLIIGLFVSLLDGNKKIKNSFDVYVKLSDLKTTNNSMDNCINNSGSKNYDLINRHISDATSTILYIQKRIIKYGIEDENILNTFKKLQKNFEIKMDIIQQCKTSNSIINNTYKNFIQLFKMVKQQIAPEDKTILDNIIFNAVLINKLKIMDEVDVFRQLVSTKYKNNDQMQLLYKNLYVYKSNFTKIQTLQQTSEQQNLMETINHLTNFFTIYNQDIVNKARFIVFIFIFALFGTLILNYVLTRKIDKTYRQLNTKTQELESSLKIINQNVIISKTNLKGIITDVSEAFCQITGYTKDELIGKNHNIVRHPDMKSEVFENLWKTIREDQQWEGEVKNLKSDGGYYWVHAVIKPYYTNGIKAGYTSVRHDITDKNTIKDLNESLEDRIQIEVDKNRQKDQQLFQQSRLAQMGEMISMIAHQWRQPLAAISSTSAGINIKAKLDKLTPDTAIELSDKISEYSQHLSQTINDFRDFFKSNKEKENTNYDEIIYGVLNIVENSIVNQNITLVKNLNSKETFNTYSNELKQVVLNLMKNAEDVLLDKEIKNPMITIETKDNLLIISDNGGGIPNEIMDKIFDPYFSTKTKKDGTGLGLYMSKVIIEEHCDGKLMVANSETGAQFSITLPINKCMKC
ncbi:MAG: PAS domain-containing sensor histidine kinase [Campylobacterota bacterium]|nr:PAS domain-containing sensor histidine kinase [Campylobacterota bacterium]